MLTSTQESMPERRRVVSISARDVDGNYAHGAEIRFVVAGSPYGAAEIGAEPVTIELPFTVDFVLDVFAIFQGEQQEARLEPGLNNYTFQFSTATLRAFRPGVARCPDGTSGQPCVVCMIGGLQVRICA